MRIHRFLFTALLTVNAFAAVGRADEVQPAEFVVNQQVIRDVAIGNGALAGRLASGRVAGRIASAASYVGDLARGARPGEVGCVPRTYGYPDLFYNFYTQGNCNQTNAQMYVAPVPVPPNVGHTFYTYQPFMPHEMLYWHTDRFHNYYDGGRGMNHTKVHYYAPPVKQAVSNLYWNYLRIPR